MALTSRSVSWFPSCLLLGRGEHLSASQTDQQKCIIPNVNGGARSLLKVMLCKISPSYIDLLPTSYWHKMSDPLKNLFCTYLSKLLIHHRTYTVAHFHWTITRHWINYTQSKGKSFIPASMKCLLFFSPTSTKDKKFIISYSHEMHQPPYYQWRTVVKAIWSCMLSFENFILNILKLHSKRMILTHISGLSKKSKKQKTTHTHILADLDLMHSYHEHSIWPPVCSCTVPFPIDNLRCHVFDCSTKRKCLLFIKNGLLA